MGNVVIGSGRHTGSCVRRRWPQGIRALQKKNLPMPPAHPGGQCMEFAGSRFLPSYRSLSVSSRTCTRCQKISRLVSQQLLCCREVILSVVWQGLGLHTGVFKDGRWADATVCLLLSMVWLLSMTADMDKTAQRLTVDVIGIVGFSKDFACTDLSTEPTELHAIQHVLQALQVTEDGGGALSLCLVGSSKLESVDEETSSWAHTCQVLFLSRCLRPLLHRLAATL